MRRPLVAAFDLLTVLLLMFVILALTDKPPKPPHIRTPGVLAVSDAWPAGSNDDIDMYVRDPSGMIVYFADPSEGLMNLEYDDLGTAVTGTQTLPDGRRIRTSYNGERVVLRGTAPGEYTVNIHMYQRKNPGTTAVVVQLWLLRGNDEALLNQRLVMRQTGDEQTAFRFTLNSAGDVVSHNRLPAHMVQALGQGVTPPTVIP